MAVGPFWLSRHNLDTSGKRANISGRETSMLGKGGPEVEDRNVGIKLLGDPCAKKARGEAGGRAWDHLVKGRQEAWDDESPR